MTKKEMIQSMQQQEARLFLEAKKSEFKYGRLSTPAETALAKWLGVSQLMEALGIEEDTTLPEVAEAVEYICLISKRDKAAAERLY